MPARRKPRLLVLNQYYWPGVEATAQLLTELCEALAAELEIRVVTGVLHGHEDRPRREVHNGIEVIRVPSTSFERSKIFARAANYASYLTNALLRGVRGPRPDIVLCMTDPPIIADIALLVARRYRAPLVVISQDVFPEIAVELKRLENRALMGLLRGLVRLYLRRADRIVAIGDTMRRRLEEKGAPPGRLRVIPNWVDTKRLAPQGKDNAWAHSGELTGKFVIMHSGNVGHAQDLDSLVRAASFLRDLDDIRIMVIGMGARHAELVALAELLEVDQVKFLYYQSRAVLPQSLSAADVHVVGLAPGLAGYVVPSRLYGVLAVARPVIVAADAESETAQIVQKVGCGIVVPPGRPELLARAIRDAHDGKYDLDAMGARGRAWVEREADRSVAVRRYRDLLFELAS
ncbi:MAG: colanic acid biosynthesis glycosyl transferase WcaI [Gaiellaceae bacterium]|jgi:glycosyltransferase involved in cell wall biosynthesis|nr:colanic acid biosynthesis glycosyl transferase WcaI [Gaiellaceae bacterium]